MKQHYSVILIAESEEGEKSIEASKLLTASELLDAAVQVNGSPSGIAELLEVHYDISVELQRQANIEDSPIQQAYQAQGRGGMYELAMELTMKFTKQYGNVAWGEELDYTDTMESFLEQELR